MILGNPFVFVDATHPAMFAFGDWLDTNHPHLPAFKCYLISLVLDKSCREAVFIDTPIDHDDLMPTILDSSPEGVRLLSDIFESVSVDDCPNRSAIEHLEAAAHDIHALAERAKALAGRFA